MSLNTIPPAALFNAFTETLGIWYYYVALGFDFIGNRLGTSGALAVSPIIDLPRRPVKSSLHLVQSPFGVFTVGWGEVPAAWEELLLDAQEEALSSWEWVLTELELPALGELLLDAPEEVLSA